MLGKRHKLNPLISPEDIIPSRDDFEVIGVFNPGAIRVKDEIYLLLRVAERPKRDAKVIHIPVLAPNGTPEKYPIRRITFNVGDPSIDSSDPRVLLHHGKIFITSISHFRLARSTDGCHFTIDTKPTIFPEGEYEEYGIEDPRIMEIDGVYYITYSAVSSAGICTGLISTKNWKTFKRMGNIFHPTNKDCAFFPEKIKGNYIAFHRPDTVPFNKPSIWLAKSKDLIHWGEHEKLISPRDGYWDSERIGAGAPPLKTSKGWLEIYHGVSEKYGYALGALLLDLENPSRIIARSKTPIVEPKESYEKKGFFQNTIFTDGFVRKSGDPDKLLLYYGAADKNICMQEISLKDILASLKDS